MRVGVIFKKAKGSWPPLPPPVVIRLGWFFMAKGLGRLKIFQTDKVGLG